MTKYLVLLLSLSPIFLTGCTDGHFDTLKFVRNPVIMVLIAIITLYLAFKYSGGKKK